MGVVTIKDNFIELYRECEHLTLFACVIIFTVLFVFCAKRVIAFLFNKIGQKYGQDYLKLDERHHVSRYLFHSAIVLYLILCTGLLNIDVVLPAQLTKFKSIVIIIYSSFAFTGLLLSLINIFAQVYKGYFLDKHFPIHLPIQILKIFIVVLAFIIIVSQLLNVSPLSIVTSLGATTAFLTFVFRDAILGLIASLQLILQNKIQIGDQIIVPQHNVNGEVETITITEVRIRTNNGGIIIVPPSHLLTANITNLRDIKKAKPRKIGRVIHLDINSAMFCSKAMLDQLEQSVLLNSTVKELLNISSKNEVTNLEVFKLYTNLYLKEYLTTRNQLLSFSVQESETSLLGLVSLEINIPLDKIEWKQYELMKSEIFFHLIAVLPEFKIKVSPK